MKISLENGEAVLPHFNEGEIWWCSLGENVGTEINGKGLHFTRPMVILIKLDEKSFIGVPLTSKIKKGSWYFPMPQNENGTAIMAQARYVDYKRMDKMISTMDWREFERLRASFVMLLYHNKSPAHHKRADVGNPKLDDSVAPKEN